MFKRFNLYSFFLKLLPPVLRTDGIKAFLWTLLKPIDDILARFRSAVDDANIRQTHNSFAIYLEKFLNDLFGLENVITIIDIVDEHTIYLSKKDEIYDYDYMTMRVEDDTTLVLPSSRPGEFRGKFAVLITAELDTQENRALITKWVNYYKFAGTQFIIKQYE